MFCSEPPLYDQTAIALQAKISLYFENAEINNEYLTIFHQAANVKHDACVRLASNDIKINSNCIRKDAESIIMLRVICLNLTHD